MTLSISAKIALSAAASRVLCLSIGLLSARYLHPYDTSGNIYPGAQDGLGRWLSPLAYWDGVYFLRTAEIKGYGYEHTHAFFPGLPIAINLFEGLLPSAMPRMDRLLLSGLLITNISFVVAAVLLYWLGLAVLSGDHAASIAYYGALFFAIPMSNIFMSAIYTESLYCLLTFGGLLLLYSTSKGHHTGALVSSAVLLAAATLTRSNGTLNAPFFVSYGIHNRCILLVIPLVLLIVLPMVVYLHYARSLYCYDGDDLASRPWCSGRGNVYSYIQKEYWHVGLFDYYTPKNIPNFLLAIPSMTIAITAVVRGLLVYCPPLRKALSPKAWLHGVVTAANDYDRSPFVFQLMVLTLFTLLCANVQVITRLLTGCPLYYWQLGKLYSDAKLSRGSRVLFSVYLLFHCAYFFIGPVMFCNFLPWT